jgi:hypothetical protein
MKIAVFDYSVTRNSPVGSCHLAMLRALSHEHDFTVFSVEFRKELHQGEKGVSNIQRLTALRKQ